MTAGTGMRTMYRLNKISLGVIAWLVLIGAGRSDPTKQVILIQSSDVTLRADPDSAVGRYYTLSYEPPEALSGADLERAVLELVVDVSAKQREGYVSEAPVLEIYALIEPLSDDFDPGRLHRASRSVRPVAAGAGRHVVLDITTIVRSHLEGAIRNHGLVLGSVTGMREGEFIVVPGNFPQGAVAQVRIYRRHEVVPAVRRAQSR